MRTFARTQFDCLITQAPLPNRKKTPVSGAIICYFIYLEFYYFYLVRIFSNKFKTYKENYMLVTNPAPDFTATAVLADGSIVDDFKLSQNLGTKGAVLFFYPLDFTFVCPSEIIAFSHRIEEFKNRGINVIGYQLIANFHTLHGERRL